MGSVLDDVGTLHASVTKSLDCERHLVHRSQSILGVLVERHPAVLTALGNHNSFSSRMAMIVNDNKIYSDAIR